MPKLIFILWLLFGLSFFASAQEAQHDTLRAFDREQLKEYAKDPLMNYGNEAVDSHGFGYWLTRILIKILETIFSDEGPAPYIRYFVAALIVVWAVYKLVGKNIVGGFEFRNRRSGLHFNKVEDDINDPHLEDKLREAIAQKAYRTAVRLQFLILLRQMEENSLIEWKPEKTNRQYSGELRNGELRAHFIRLARYYDYVWYGNFVVSEWEYDEIAQDFKQVVKLI